jgi:penicillin-binding protein 1A
MCVALAPLAASAQQASPDAEPGTGEPWQIIPLAQSSLVYARDGSLIGEIGREQRTNVALKSLPAYVSQAFIAVEDQRFYDHNGVDIRGVLGAIKGKVTGSNRGGASTITQQLVGYMHPDVIDRRQVSGMSGIERKLHEQEAALEMERHYTKAQILEAYLNQIYLGHSWYGVDAGARHYFGKPASQLTVAQAALLAALPKSQTYYDPERHPDRALARRNLILGMMADQGYLTASRAAEAQAEPLGIAPNDGMSASAGYFVDAVRQQARSVGIPVSSGGYRIYTTLDPELQRDAVAALVSGTAKVEKTPGYRHLRQAEAHGKTDYLQGAVVVMDPRTGDVRALVGGRNHALAPFNRAVDAYRQPGSSVKPIVYAAALMDSIPANAIVPDTALAITLPSGDVYEPQDDDGQFLGDITIREALVHSRNSVAIQLGMFVGMDTVSQLAQRLGIKSPMMPVPASAIGASAVHPIEMATAYTAFANNGAVVQPRFIARVDDMAGRSVWNHPAAPAQQVLDPRVAYIIRSMLTDVADHGTGRPARALVPARVPVAGKTGTTNDNVDVWFVGLTPGLVAAVWLGFDRSQTIMPGAYGSALAAPIWGQMIGQYYANHAAPTWGPPPDGLTWATLDRATGQLATVFTPPEQQYTEFFLPGTQPLPLRDDPWAAPQWGPFILRP